MVVVDAGEGGQGWVWTVGLIGRGPLGFASSTRCTTWLLLRRAFSPFSSPGLPFCPGNTSLEALVEVLTFVFVPVTSTLFVTLMLRWDGFLDEVDISHSLGMVTATVTAPFLVALYVVSKVTHPLWVRMAVPNAPWFVRW